MSILFHPEMPFALLCALATLVVPARAAPRLAGTARLVARRGARRGGADAPARGRRDGRARRRRRSSLGGRRAAGFLVRARDRRRPPRRALVGLRGLPLGQPAAVEPRAARLADAAAAAGVVLRLVPVRGRSSSTRSGPTSPTSCCRSCTPSSGATGSASSTGPGDPVAARARHGLDAERARASSPTCSRSAGLVALALPAAVRVVRRRSRAPTDVGLGAPRDCSPSRRSPRSCVMLIRFPQQLRRPDQVELPALHRALLGGVLGRGVERAPARRRTVGTSSSPSEPASTSRATRADLGGALARSAAAPSLGGAAGYVDLVTAHPAELAEPGRRRDDRLPRRRENTRRPDRELARAHRPPPGRDAPGRAAVLRARLRLHRHLDDHLRPRLPRRRLLDADPLLGAGDEAGAADDDRGRDARRRPTHGRATTRRATLSI